MSKEESENENENEDEDYSLIQQSLNHGIIDQESKHWDDVEEIGKKEILKYKISKIKLFSTKNKEKEVLLGVEVTYTYRLTGETKNFANHIGTDPIFDSKEMNLKSNEYLSDFNIKCDFLNDCITKLGYGTTKQNKILIGNEEDENQIIETNGIEYIIVGIFGCYNKRLDGIGFYYVKQKDYFNKIYQTYFILRYVAKKDNKFKKEWEKRYKELPIQYQYMWRTVNLPDTIFSGIIKYC
jgi:hypothetical protein